MSNFTDANDFEKSMYRQYGNLPCNQSAFKFVEENPNAVAKVGESPQGHEHCWVYDPATNLTIDVTLGQFDGLEPGYWEGDEHPHCDEWDEFSDPDEFENEYGGAHSPFLF